MQVLNTRTKLLACSENIDLTLSKTPLKDLSQLKSIKYGLFLRLGHTVLNVNIWQEKSHFWLMHDLQVRSNILGNGFRGEDLVHVWHFLFYF